MPSPNEITAAQLSRLIGTPNAPMLIDVRIDEYLVDDPYLLPTAFRHPAEKIAELAPKLAGRAVVLYCKKGKKFSLGAAALLNDLGIKVEILAGGYAAWKDAGLPLLPISSYPVRNTDNRTVWVTRHRPKIDRIACPWLIRRFIDPNALFMFVPPAEVGAVAESFAATPFDVDDVFWSHRGEYCTFDTMLDEFNLNTEPLDRLATIVRGADTGRLDLAPECSGLLAASLGLSRMFRNDMAQLDAGMALYDSFYRWARDATAESHNSPVSAKG